MLLLLNVIKRRLFEDSEVRTRILRDYGVRTTPRTPDEFANAIISQFDRAVLPRPLEQDLTNDDVFRAAVRALASNSRAWVNFCASNRASAIC
jgi:hypothetical protein